MPHSKLNSAIEWLQHLISFPSVSSSSNESITQAVADRVEGLGFTAEITTYEDDRGVRKANLVARREPNRKPNQLGVEDHNPRGVAYFCHTDVVPVTSWTGPGDAFGGSVADGRLFGRGSCDMKGSLATLVAALESLSPTDQVSPIWVVATADEEVGFEGAQHLIRESEAFREIVQDQPLAIIGEPTSLRPHHAHKGITGFRVTNHGKAAHSSTIDGINANHAMVPILNRLLEIEQRTRTDKTYQDERFDPPTLSWNFGVSDHMTAVNITPPQCDAWCSLRTMPNIDGEDLISEMHELATSSGMEFQRFPGSPPMWIDADAPFMKQLVKMTGAAPTTVCYGTDGGVLTELRHRVVIGPGSIDQAHTSDEYLELDQINKGTELYSQILQHWAY